MILRRVLAATLVMGGLLAAVGVAVADDASRAFNVPADRVFTVTRSVLKSLGWDIDKEDRDVAWIVTDSRRLDGNRRTMSVERRVYEEERISDDRSVEERIPDEIGRSL
jgi:hypothetical protein